MKNESSTWRTNLQHEERIFNMKIESSTFRANLHHEERIFNMKSESLTWRTNLQHRVRIFNETKKAEINSNRYGPQATGSWRRILRKPPGSLNYKCDYCDAGISLKLVEVEVVVAVVDAVVIISLGESHWFKMEFIELRKIKNKTSRSRSFGAHRFTFHFGRPTPMSNFKRV